MQSSSRRGRVGRKPLDPNGTKPRAITVYLPPDLYEKANAVAIGERLPLTRVLSRMVAEGLGERAPSYCYPPEQRQDELPLARAS
jgi:hypothetical protein